MSEEHTSLPVHIPDVKHLSNDELHALRNKALNLSRDARKKSGAAIIKIPTVKKLWIALLGANANNPDRPRLIRELEKELLRFPAVYFLYAYANSLFVLDAAFRAEMDSRNIPVGPPKKKKTLVVIHPAPAAPTEDRPPWDLGEE
jgi:hypothetical protein